MAAPAFLAIVSWQVHASGADEPSKVPAPAASTLLPGATEGFVNSGGVKIHYVSLGKSEDPLMVLIHGFPDFWYSWRAQMPALAKRFHVVAIDQRGYNLSDQPEGVAELHRSTNWSATCSRWSSISRAARR